MTLLADYAPLLIAVSAGMLSFACLYYFALLIVLWAIRNSIDRLSRAVYAARKQPEREPEWR
jgi:hypothetical protein